MRIFEVLTAAATGGLISSLIWLRNLYEPLIDLEHEVFLFRAEEAVAARHNAVLRASFSQVLLDTFKYENAKRPFDLFFTYLKDGMVENSVIDEVRRTGVPTCNFSCNNTHQFDLVDDLSPHFDYNLHSEKDAADKFKQISANPIWFPMAANPKYYYPMDIFRSLDVVFVGQCYACRPNYIWQLLESGIDIHVYGPGWRLRENGGFKRELLRRGRRYYMALRSLIAGNMESRARWSANLAWLDLCERLRSKYNDQMHTPISDDEMNRKYSESKISLGFLEVYDKHDLSAYSKQHLHLRDFEAPMSGALYLTGYCEELEEFFEIDKEVIVYRNEYELLDKVRYYLSHPHEGEAIRHRGHMRSLHSHTYQRRFSQLFYLLGLNK